MKNIYNEIRNKISKKYYTHAIFLIILFLLIFLFQNSFAAVIKSQANFAPNNISTWIWNTGVFNQDLRVNNTPGFEWPRGSRKFALFTSGLSIGAFVGGNLRMGNASYNGEYAPGYVGISDGQPVFKTDARFRLYSVKRNDTYNTNLDYREWKNMVPYGAPFLDVNQNRIFDELIDKPGMEDAAQTVFICFTDADPSNHTTSEGFSGGTLPLYAEVHLTAWGYDLEALSDMQYFKWVVINKCDSAWKKTYFSIVTDPDLGDATDDYIGCDTSLQLTYCYNADNNDGTGTVNSYGANPPAVGQAFLRSAISRANGVVDTLKMKSVCYFKGTGSPGPTCEQDPSSAPLNAYNYMKGIKKDGTPWLNPFTNPIQTTTFCYSGNPEDSTGWTERKGRIQNCNGALFGELVPSPPGDRRMVLSSGSDYLTVTPGDTQKIVITQLVARGNNNLNSVTKLKELTRLARSVYYLGVNETETPYEEEYNTIPQHYILHQNYPNPFNPFTTIRYEMKKLWKVKIQVYDTRGELISTLVNEEKPQGVYEIQFDASQLPSGVYFIKMSSGGGFEDSKKMVVIK